MESVLWILITKYNIKLFTRYTFIICKKYFMVRNLDFRRRYYQLVNKLK